MIRVTAMLIAAAIAGAGCGGSEKPPASQTASGSSAAPEPAETNGCKLVTKEEVGAALGVTVGEGEEFGLNGCEWKTASRERVSLQPYAGSMLVSGTCNSQKSLLSGRQVEIAGLGDSATWVSSGDLVVCTAKAVLKIDVDNTSKSPDEDRETAVAVAKAALGRL